jgi:hypothetical protein
MEYIFLLWLISNVLLIPGQLAHFLLRFYEFCNTEFLDRLARIDFARIVKINASFQIDLKIRYYKIQRIESRNEQVGLE